MEDAKAAAKSFNEAIRANLERLETTGLALKKRSDDIARAMGPRGRI